MYKLSTSLRNWNTKDFSRTLKQELENLPTGVLPLEQGTSQGGLVDDSDISVTVINSKDDDRVVTARVGVFFGEVVGGCNCADDPAVENTYCEIQLQIDKATAETEFHLYSTT